MVTDEEQKTINKLQANWIWAPDWVDTSQSNTAGRIVRFRRKFNLAAPATRTLLHFSADTRYKLYINGIRVAVGPARSSLLIWYCDTLDIAPYLGSGNNEIRFEVLRYFAASRGAMPFERTTHAGLTAVGSVELEAGAAVVELTSGVDWEAQVDDSILFPTGLVDDGFLHISERIAPTIPNPWITPVLYGMKTLNGDLLPWRLRPRAIPMAEESPVAVSTVRACQSTASINRWTAHLAENRTITLPGGSSHVLEVQAHVHSTAFLQWTFRATAKQSQIRLKVTYSEGYELEPRNYPFFRTKADRLDAEKGYLIGPYDELILDLPHDQTVTYEPFWFRTFRILRLEISVGPEPVQLLSFDAIQVIEK